MIFLHVLHPSIFFLCFCSSSFLKHYVNSSTTSFSPLHHLQSSLLIRTRFPSNGLLPHQLWSSRFSISMLDLSFSVWSLFTRVTPPFLSTSPLSNVALHAPPADMSPPHSTAKSLISVDALVFRSWSVAFGFSRLLIISSLFLFPKRYFG